MQQNLEFSGDVLPKNENFVTVSNEDSWNGNEYHIDWEIA